MSTELFNVIRGIKGSGLTQAEVDRVNRALAGGIAAAAGAMKTSAKGIALIKSFESLALKAYPDPGSKDGKPVSIGWGSTSDEQGKPIAIGTVWTEARADARFLADLAKVEIGVNMLLGGAPTTQGQYDALVSFAYNCGLDIDDDTIAEGLGDSTLLKKHLASDYAGAKAQFALWNKNDDKVLAGLVRRRAAEAALYAS
ncbi:lysozyme [Flavisphingomonas formosensis]|uniref:lysozyme n=1 Tax=Flavisphingomonas formosensis TaxID=861534 RepID=UPI001E50FFBF|nr:lysozyme [Sphingomonas formosensis]